MIYSVDESAAEEHVQLWHHRGDDLLVAHTECSGLVFKVGSCVLSASSQRKETPAHCTLIHISSPPLLMINAFCKVYPEQAVLDSKHFSFKSPDSESPCAHSNHGWKWASARVKG